LLKKAIYDSIRTLTFFLSLEDEGVESAEVFDELGD
jgi:hypothetical protein